MRTNLLKYLIGSMKFIFRALNGSKVPSAHHYLINVLPLKLLETIEKQAALQGEKDFTNFIQYSDMFIDNMKESSLVRDLNERTKHKVNILIQKEI